MTLVAKLGNANAQGEYYLTDVVELARAEGLSAGVVVCDPTETLGINTAPNSPPPRPPSRPVPAPRRWKPA